MKNSILLNLTWLAVFQMLHFNSLQAQDLERCSTPSYQALEEQLHPGYLQQVADGQSIINNYAATHPLGSQRSQITIPVVVHVVYNTSVQNISTEQIQSQIDVLNEDFNRLNADTNATPEAWKSVGAGMDVQFCLARYDPNGDSTSGIVRTQTDIETFDMGDEMKYTAQGGDDAWPCDHYLNIWVCNLAQPTLGYTTLPVQNCSDGDGVVVLYRAFGRGYATQAPYNKGRTTTHEVGHWLGLSHTFGDDGGTCSGDDGCSDTPREADAIYNCPAFPVTDACSGLPNGVMFMNYMDYTDDGCMNIFTQCQISKCLATMSTLRQSILSSPGGCQGVAFNLDASISTIIAPVDTLSAQGFEPQVQLTNRGKDTLSYVTISYQVDGQPPLIYDWQGTLASQQSIPVLLPVYFTGEYGHTSVAWTSAPNHSTDEFVYNDSATASFVVSSTSPKNTTHITIQQGAATNMMQVTVLNPSAATMHIQIVNVLGQVIVDQDWDVYDHASFTLNLTDEAPGVYFFYGKVGYDFVKEKIMVLR